jgi:O-antigen/teichoic acid export membrane protein
LSTVQRVAKNTGVLLAGNIIFRLISLFVIIYLARYLGSVEFGKYSFVFAYLAFFGILTDLGISSILVREMSRDHAAAPKLIGNAYILRWIFTVFAVVLSLIIINLMSYPADTTTYVYIAAFTLLFQSFSGLYSTMFQANLRMEYNIFGRLASRVLSATLILWIIFAKGTLKQVMIALVLSEMINTFISYSFSRKFVRPKFTIDLRLWKHLLKESFPLALSDVVWVIYFQTDTVMLSIMQGDVATGIYSAAHKLFEPLLLIPTALMISMFPIMSASFKSTNEKLTKSYRLSFKYLFIIALPIVIGVIPAAEQIISEIFGRDFVNSTTVLQILILALVFAFTSTVPLNSLIAINKQKLYTLSLASSAIVNVVLNFVLIPLLSYNGAAIATVFTYILLFFTSTYFISNHLVLPRMYKVLIKSGISGSIMGAFIYYFSDFNIFLIIGTAGLLYFTALLLLKTFSEEDWNILRKLISKR